MSHSTPTSRINSSLLTFFFVLREHFNLEAFRMSFNKQMRAFPGSPVVKNLPVNEEDKSLWYLNDFALLLNMGKFLFFG